jgi:hypothetical protein
MANVCNGSNPVGRDRQKSAKSGRRISLDNKEAMDHQLVLQFKGENFLDLDALVSLEDKLQEVIEQIGDVDGHDMGSGEANIFVLTADPIATFERAKPLLSEASLLNTVRAAYRDVRSDVFTVLWPERSTEAFVVA